MCPNGSGRWPSASWAGLWVKWNSLISRRDSGRDGARPCVLQAGGASSVLLLEMEHMATAKGAAPVGGFNHNVKYGPRVYHVQTEDSGLPHAHYITHLFVGGNIVASMKTSYADRAAEPDLAKVVRGLMEGQHKVMLKRLVSGEFDELADRLAAPHYDPGVLADGTNTASYVNTAPSAPAAAKPVARPVPKAAPPLPQAAPPKPVAPAAKPPAPAPKPAAPVWH